MDKNRKRGIRRAINKHRKRAYHKDHLPSCYLRQGYGQYCWKHNDHPHRSKDCRSCKVTRYYKSNEAELDADYKDWLS